MDELQLVRDFFGEPPPPGEDIAAAARAGMTAGGPAVRRRFAWRRVPARPHGLLLRLGIPAVAATAAAAVIAAVMVQGSTARPQPAGAHARTAVTAQGELRNAILTAFNAAGGDVFYAKITETYPGKMSRWNGVEQNWSYPIQPQAGQQVHIRSVLVPSNPNDKSDSELIYTEPSGAKAMLPTRTEVIFVQYGNRTWSDTSALVASQSPAASLQELRDSITTGDFTAPRKTELNGQTVLELTASAQTVWLDPATYLPVRTISDDSGIKIQVDYGFLPPTPANMAELKAPIPPGFTRTATIQKGP